jgi:hypothetical protein
MSVATIMELRKLAKTDPRYAKFVTKVSIDLGGPERPFSECLKYLETFALEVGEDAVMDEVNHAIQLSEAKE